MIFATGTPVSNSMTELYTVMRYLQYSTLQQKNLTHFDSWASTFGETTTAIELAPEGTGYRARTRFAKFFNLPELMNMLSNGQEDENGILFICFPVTAIAAVLSRSPMTVKRSLNELETAGLIMRVRQGVGEPNRIYVLIPGKEDAALA